MSKNFPTKENPQHCTKGCNQKIYLKNTGNKNSKTGNPIWLPYNLDDLDPGPEKKQYHSGELIARDRIFVHMDLQQTGVGGIDSWGAWPVETYQIPFKNYKYSYWIRLVK